MSGGRFIGPLGKTSTIPAAGTWWDARFFMVLAIYYALHAGIRCLFSGSLELDEAELAVAAQQLSWGYGAQPPLYVWLQRLAGISVPSMAFLKALLLWLTVVTIHYSAWLATEGDRSIARLSVGSLFLIPEFAWHVHVDRTHTVLATLFVAILLVVLLRSVRESRFGGLWLCGVMVGLGALAKHTFAVPAGCLLLTALAVPNWRARLITGPMLAGFVCGALIFLPAGLWMLKYRELALSQTWKLQLDTTVTQFRVGLGLWGLVRGLASTLGPLVIFNGALRLFAGWQRLDLGEFPQAVVHWLRRYLGVIVSLLFLFTVAGLMTRVRTHWFLPASVPVAVMMAIITGNGLNVAVRNLLVRLLGVIMLGVLISVPIRTMASAGRGQVSRLAAPLGILSPKIRADFPGANLIISPSQWLGGCLKLNLPDVVVAVPGSLSPPIPADANALLVWEGPAGASSSPDFLRWMENLGFKPGSAGRVHLTAPYRWHPETSLSLNVVTVVPK